MSNHSAGLRVLGPIGAWAFTDAVPDARSGALCRGSPELSSEALGRLRSPPVSLAARLPIESHLACEPVIDRACSRVGQAGSGLACIRFFLQAGEVCLGCRMGSEAQDGGVSKGPLERGVAHWGAGWAIPCSGGFPGPLDQAARGDNILPPGATVDLGDFVEPHATENLANTGHGLQQIQGVGIRVLGGCDDGEFHGAQQLGIGGDERSVDCETFLHRWIGKAFGNARPVGWVGDLLTDGWPMIRAGGMWAMGPELGPFMGERPATSEEVAGGAHLGGINTCS